MRMRLRPPSAPSTGIFSLPVFFASLRLRARSVRAITPLDVRSHRRPAEDSGSPPMPQWMRADSAAVYLGAVRRKKPLALVVPT